MIVLMTGSFVRTKRQRISNGKVGRGPRISFQPGGGWGVCACLCRATYICMLHLPLYWSSSTALYFNSNVDSDGQHMQTTDTMKNKEISLMEKFGGSLGCHASSCTCTRVVYDWLIDCIRDSEHKD
jgi:hypothetical protein